MEKCEFLSSFNHCPKCGGSFEDNNSKSKRCAECGFVYYFNPSAAVAAIIKNKEGEILISRRANDPAKGTFDLPGGFVDPFESAERSACREIQEECNLVVKSCRYLFSLPNIYNYSNFDVHTLDMIFECEVDDFSPMHADDDVASLQFVPLDKLEPEQFGLPSIRKAIEIYIRL